MSKPRRLSFHSVVVYCDGEAGMPLRVSMESGLTGDGETVVTHVMDCSPESWHDAAAKVLEAAHALVSGLRQLAREEQEGAS
jgi:hypothetical protein